MLFDRCVRTTKIYSEYEMSDKIVNIIIRVFEIKFMVNIIS